jgi:RHS repeat-associated protein
MYVDSLVVRDRDTAGIGQLDERLYAIQDANWTVTAIVAKSGGVVERYVYDPYGQPTILTQLWEKRMSSGYGWILFHQGERFDMATGLYIARRRIHSPMLGRWLQVDPIGHGSGWNLYEYENGNPRNSLDPEGTVPRPQGPTFPNIAVKRLSMKLSEVFHITPGTDDTWGHYWTEITDEGTTVSYGWWPLANNDSIWTIVWNGVPGELNGVTSFGGGPDKDPKHGKTADAMEHPRFVGPNIGNLLNPQKMKYGPDKGSVCLDVCKKYKADRLKVAPAPLQSSVAKCLKEAAKDFAKTHKVYRVNIAPDSYYCWTFQTWLLDQCCLWVLDTTLTRGLKSLLEKLMKVKK